MLELKDCAFEYPTKKIFEGLTIRFKENAINGVLGRNGIGKTTLFKILTNVLKVGKGQIELNGVPLNPTDVSILHTAPFFYPYMKGEEYLKLVLGTFSEQAVDLAAVFNLPLDELIDNYSTGMRKKIAFIAVLCQDRPVLILDEPFNGVDLEGNELMKAILKREKEGRVIICSSHILESLTDSSDTIHFIQEGYQYELYEKNNYELLNLAIGRIIDSKIESLGAKS